MAAASGDLTIDASIIVCTRNRAIALSAVLASLGAAKVPAHVRYEIIVVDNASTDDTRAAVESVAATLPVHYVYEPRAGLSRARNTGLAQARGRLILFTDDDCIVSDDWLETGLALLADDPRQLIGGRVDLHDPRDLPMTIKTDPDSSRLTSIGQLVGFLHGCNMIFGRCVLDEIGLFDLNMGPGTLSKAADDTDLVYRAFHAGIPVRYCPVLRLRHNHGRRNREDVDRLEGDYMESLGALAMKHLLRGRWDLLQAIYWKMHSDVRSGRPARKHYYICGMFGYVQASISGLFRSR